MELIHLLKKLKSITADAEYTRRSRELLCGIEQKEILAPRNFRSFVTHMFQFGSAIALAGFLILLVIGGFTFGNFFSPFRLGSLDPKSLRVEAEAIDIQIQLTNLGYEGERLLSLEHETTTVRSAFPAEKKARGVENDTANREEASPQKEDVLTIEEVLAELSE